jgi:hypothetical protein
MIKQAHGSVAADRRRGGFHLLLPKNEKGIALMTVLVFSFIFLILTMTFFTVASYEAGQAENRENSTRAFYMADGAIEKAKAKLLTDGADWTTGFPKTAQDNGFFKLTVDTVLYQGAYHSRFYAEGYFARAKRDVEVIADIVPATLGLSIYARHNIELRGNICLDGHAHADGEIDGEDHFDLDGPCDPTWSSGTPINPPPVYLEPDSFPGATYYFVTADRGQGNDPDILYIKDRNFNTLQTYLEGVATPSPPFTWTYDQNSHALEVTVNGPSAFDQASSVFRRDSADNTVIINFGGRLKDYDNPLDLDHEITNLTIQVPGNGQTVLQSTIINTRYRVPMATIEDRLDYTKWMGGEIRTKSWATFEPIYCIAFITQRIKGNAQQSLGTAAHPALSYIMETGDFSTGQWTIYGSLVCLGDITVGGGVNLTFDSDFIDCLPPHLSENWPQGSSGVMNVLRWREPPPRT